MTRRGRMTFGLAVILAAVTAAVPLAAQRGGRGGGGGAPPGVAVAETRSRLEIITQALTLDRDQRNAAKTALDAAHKAAAPLRADLAKTRADLGAAVQAGKPQAEIDAAVNAYGAAAAAMAAAEMKALAQVLSPLRAEQRAAGTMTTFYLMRGIFLDDRRWDEIPEPRAY